MRGFIIKSQYARNVYTLIVGTTLAQFISIALSPILTRLYSPEEFGLFALFVSAIVILSVFVTGRYELAIMLPRRDRDALHITILAIMLSVAINLALLFIIFFVHSFTPFFDNSALVYWFYWVPVSTLLLGIHQSLSYWSNRKCKYKRLAISRTLQSTSSAMLQIGVGYVGIGAVGLISGHIVGQVLAIGVFGFLVWREDRKQIRTFNLIRSFALAKKYINFPKFLIAAHGFNIASAQMPVLLLTALFNIKIAGFFTLTQRVISAPIALISGAIGDVFRQEASYAYIHQGNCQEIYKKTFKRLVLISIFPFAIFFFLAPELFSLIFGEPWRTAGEYAKILAPMAFLQFITSPLSSMFIIAEKQRLDLLWQVFLIVLIVISFSIGKVLSDSTLALILVSITGCIAYTASGIMTFIIAKNKI
jgi:O-antigen/teichoic acid export membrane protein